MTSIQNRASLKSVARIFLCGLVLQSISNLNRSFLGCVFVEKQMHTSDVAMILDNRYQKPLSDFNIKIGLITSPATRRLRQPYTR